MGYPRPVVAGGTYALTKRTVYRKAFLAPWHSLVMQLWLWSLAGAQRLTRVAIHHTTLNVTHQHSTITTPDEANLPRFTGYVHREMSKGLNVLLAELGYEQPRQIFEDRQVHQMRLLDADACMSHILYERLNGVAAGLVARPEDMPDCEFAFGLWKGEPLVIERPPIYCSRNVPKQRELFITVDPQTFIEFRGDLDRIVHHFRTGERRAVKAFRKARTFPVLGAKKLRRIHPWNEPRTNREVGGRVIPTFKLGARGVAGRDKRIIVCQEVTKFRRDHADANEMRQSGRNATYPAGTYKMRVEFDADVAAPEPGAVLTAPGMTLDDAVAMLCDCPELRKGTTKTPERVAKAFVHEAAEVLDEDRMTFSNPGDDAHPEDIVAESEGERPQLEVQQRAKTRRESKAAKVVTLRDYRRGRPRKPKGKEPPR